MGKSESQIICEAYTSNQISADGAAIMQALDLLKNKTEYYPRPYPKLPESLQRYVTQRLEGFVERDQHLAVANGGFLQALNKTHCYNKKSLEIITWGRAACEHRDRTDEGLGDAIAELMRLEDDHKAMPFPERIYRDGCAVQWKDVQDAMHASRGKPVRSGTPSQIGNMLPRFNGDK
jgi:hypothetical protein